jgi:DNA adenine methylase
MTTKDSKLLPPFSYWGGKRKVGSIIFNGLGQVTNYVEPFGGSLAVLLANPHPAKIETVNDIDCALVNFWRCVSNDPEGLAKYCDYPVSEVDLHARHKWILEQFTTEFKTKMNNDPNFYDLKLGGWWIYGQCASIPGNWLQTRGLKAMPMLSSAGSGIQGLKHTPISWFETLQKRLKRVRICCRDWKDLVSPAITYKNKGLVSKDITGICLDPPYEHQGRVKKLYQEDEDIFSDVMKWAIENGDNPKLRIALCGYDNDYVFPEGWTIYNWETVGGMANQSKTESPGLENKGREVIWFSPHCLKVE